MGTRIFLGKPPASIEQWIKDHQQPDLTIYKVQTTSSYMKTGIYSAERDDASKPVTIDWGDGTVETVDGNVSQKTHTYGSVGEFTVKVSNIKTFAASADNTTWRTKTSQNSYTFKELVNLNKDVTSIEYRAFYDCTSLTSVTIPDSVTSIETQAFHNCSNLTSITISDGVTSIAETAFYGCLSLTSVTIGTSVTSIGDWAFYGCNSLKSVTIPDSMTSIGYGAFLECNSSLYDTTTIPGVRLVDGWVIGTTDSLPGSLNLSGIRGIGHSAFDGCTDLASVMIPDNVTSIGEAAFSGCNALVEMTFEGMDCETVKSNALGWGIGINDDFSKHLVVCYCIDGVVVINDVSQSSDAAEPTLVKYVGDEDWTEIMIKGKLTASAIPDIYNVEQIKIGEGVTAIGADAFRADLQQCNISNVEFPSSLKKIGNTAFMGNTNLWEITFPNSLKTISDYAFTDCTGIGCGGESSINIPDSVTSIGFAAFRGCSMENVHIGTGIESIGYDAFNYCNSLTSVVFSGKTMSEIQNMDNYPWGIEDTSIIHGS